MTPEGTVGDTDEPLRVVLVTVDEHYYIPKFLDGILDAPTVEICAIVTVPPSLGTESMVSFVQRLFRTFGPVVFTKHGAFYAKYIILDALAKVGIVEEAYSCETIAARHDIAYRNVRDVNGTAVVDFVESFSPEVLVSVAATQKFERDLLETPTEAAINIHSSLLPDYRGVSPSFWTLYHDEDRTGVTVHFMEETLDTGDVIRQEHIEIATDETQHSLNEKVAAVGSRVLVEALEDIRTDTVEAKPIDPDEGDYYSMPTREEVRAFREDGNRFY